MEESVFHVDEFPRWLALKRAVVCTILFSVLIALPLVRLTVDATGPPYSWSGPDAVERSTGQDILPTALQSSNGTIWLAWQTYRWSSSRPDIAYKTMTGGAWITAQRFTSTGTNISPALAQLDNGTIILFWSQKTTGSFHLHYKRFIVDFFGVGSWSDDVELTATALDDNSPSAAIAGDGTLWLVWHRSNKTCTPTCTEDRQLYYRSLKNGFWSQEVKLTFDVNWNWGPSVMVGKDGKVRIAWSKGQNALSNYQIYQVIYDGATWGPETQIVFSNSADEHSSIIQDRNGTIWLFWGRQAESGSTIYYILYNKYSLDNGLNWSPEAQMSFAPTRVTSQTPAAIQSDGGSDKSIRVFYITSLEDDFDIWVYTSPSIYPIHDVKIIFVNPSTTIQYAGGLASIGQSPIVTITVTLSNLGDTAETVQVTVIASNTTGINLGTQTGSLSLGGSLTLSFIWDTTGVAPARYSVDVNAVPVAGETTGNAADSHVFQKSRIHLIPWGDLDQNGAVSLTDVSVFFYDFGFSSTCGCSRWNPFADINNTGIIDIIDVGVAVRNFGITT